MHIVQIVPFLGRGTGVASVASELQDQFQALGHTTETLTEARLGIPQRRPKTRLGFRLWRLEATVLFSFRGARRAREHLTQHPDAVSLCHNHALAGDVYVNHNITVAGMRARGHLLRLMLRNPLHPFTFFRDRHRYRGDTHRAIVVLTSTEERLLQREFGPVRPPVHVISNGVDLERHRPPTPAERTAARERLGLAADARVLLFVGHELERKGVGLLIDALVDAPDVLLAVVGGYEAVVTRMTEHARQRGVQERVFFAGPQTDLAPWLAAADVFSMPSEYESFGLVYVEALASGVPVIATRVGVAPDLIVDGVNGYLVDPEPAQIAERLNSVVATDVESWRAACRASVEHLSWRTIAQQYVDLLSSLGPARGGTTP